MKQLICLIAALVTLFLTACHEPDKSPETVRRTVLVYMVARNSLGSAALDDADLAEMQSAKIPADGRLLVFLSAYGDSPQLLEIADSRTKILKVYDEEGLPSAASGDMLSRVLADVRRLAPSREQGIVFWSHSSGWKAPLRLRSRVNDRSFGLDGGVEMTIQDLAAALERAPVSPDYLFFDSCYMGCAEVAYELRRCARYMVGSVAEVPTEGMPYDLTVPALFDEDMRRGLTEAIDLTADYYAPRTGPYCPSTLSLIDLTEMDALFEAFVPIVTNPQESLPASGLQRFSTSSPYSTLFVDLDHYAESVASSPVALATFREALERAVVHERHSDAIWGVLKITRCCGLSVNPRPESTDYGYQQLQWRINIPIINGKSQL